MRGRVALALILAATAAALAHSIWLGVVTDDAGIALAYARTFASGQGLRLTPLSPRVEGYSDPLWVLWLALGYALRVGGPQFARVTGAVFGALAVLATGLVPSRAEGRQPRLFDAAAPWVLAFDTTYSFWCGAGLETGAFALALAALLLLLARRSPWSVVPAGLLAVLRPEGALYLAFLAPLLARPGADPFSPPRKRNNYFFSAGLPAPSQPANFPPPPRGWVGSLSYGSDILRWLTLAALPALAWLLFRLVYYGQWLPNSYYAKRDWNFGGLSYLGSWFFHDPWHVALCFCPLALLSHRTRRAAGLALAACAAAVVFILVSRGDWLGEHRFAAHALPAAALLAGLVPAALCDFLGGRDRDVGWASALALAAAAFLGARDHSAERKRYPEFPLAYVAEQGRWFRAESRRLGLEHPRLAHFDLGGIALESGGEVIDLAGLADLYIGRVGYHDHGAVSDYLFDEVKPDLLNIHGPCQYLRADQRLSRDYVMIASGRWGENWARKSLKLDGRDDRCPSGRIPAPGQLAQELAQAPPLAARDLWLCARAHLPLDELPDVRPLAARFAAEGLSLAATDRKRARDLLDAAVSLDPTLTRASQRLLALRLAR